MLTSNFLAKLFVAAPSEVILGFINPMPRGLSCGRTIWQPIMLCNKPLNIVLGTIWQKVTKSYEIKVKGPSWPRLKKMGQKSPEIGKAELIQIAMQNLLQWNAFLSFFFLSINKAILLFHRQGVGGSLAKTKAPDFYFLTFPLDMYHEY